MDKRSKSSRRDFLKGRSAVRALRDAVEDVGRSIPEPVASSQDQINRQNAYLEHYTAKAMACEFALMFNMHQYPQSGAVTARVFELIANYESQLTIYDIESEVSQLNRNAFDTPFQVEAGLFELLSLAEQLNRSTSGAFDITSSPLSKAWGFHQREARLPEESEIEAALSKVDATQIRLDSESQSVQFGLEGMSINLGGIGKGFALDKVTQWIVSQGVGDFLFHGGQSSVVARGAQQCDDNAEHRPGWVVGLSHPMAPDRRLCEFNLTDEALGTSGTGRQGFFVEGKRYGHIIDPRSGWPTDHFLSTTVVSPSAALSDALATAFFVMSVEEIEHYCREHEAIKTVLVTQDKKGNPEILWFNLDESDWRRL